MMLSVIFVILLHLMILLSNKPMLLIAIWMYLISCRNWSVGKLALH